MAADGRWYHPADMSSCPVCENVQEGGEDCSVCGFHRGAAAAAAEVAALEGLEPTLFGAASAEGERVPDLEPTGHAAGADLPPEQVEIEPTLLAPVAPVVEPLTGLEPTLAEAIPDDGPQPAAPLLCRYCRSPAPPTDTFCFHCGMRLPREAARRPEAAAVLVPCRSCGTPSSGEVCVACGVRAVP